MRLLIVIVNYRTASLTVDCLRSLSSQIRDDMRVVVTDCLSGDDSVHKIAAAIEQNRWQWATLMPLGRNGGFAYGNNAAIRPALASDDPPEFVLLLNPDTVVRENALEPLMEFLTAHPKVGIVGSRLEDPDGTAQRSAFRFHSASAEFERGARLGLISKVLKSKVVAPPVPESAAECDWVTGASMMVRREVFLDVARASRPCHGQDARATAGLDERYFMYFEETDFCLAAQRAGWKAWYVPASRVVHLVGSASGINATQKTQKRRPTYWFDSRRRYFVKNHGVLYAALADLAFAIGFGSWRVRRWLQRKPDTDPPEMLADFMRNSVFVRGAAL